MKSSKAAKPKRSVTSVLASAPAPQVRVWHYALGFFIAFSAVYQVYSPALNGPFLLDDSTLPYMVPNFYAAPLSDWLKGLRPLLMFSYWLNFKQSGTDATYGYHVVNLVIHFFNGALIYFAMRKVLSWIHVEKFQREIIAVFSAGLFLFHPIQTESVS